MTRSGTHLTAVDVDTACRALAAAERRAILDYLLNTRTETVDFEALAKHVKGHRDDRDSETDANSLAMIILELLHQHLPHLETAGLIAFDSRSETIVATDKVESLRPLFEALKEL